MKKLILRILIVFVILLILAVVGVGMFLDSAIKKGVETAGPMVAKVDIKLDGVSLSLLSGSGKIKGLVVGNPEGFKTPHAIQVGSAAVSLSPGSLFSDKVVIKSIRVEGAEVTYEGGLLGGDNLHKILDNVTETTGGGSAPPKDKESGKAAKKLQVDDFLITGAKLNVSLKGTGGFAAPVPLPDIHLTNLGQGPEGITGGELAHKALTALTADAGRIAGKVLSDAGKGAVTAAENVGKSAVDSAGKAAKGVTDLFKKKKE